MEITWKVKGEPEVARAARQLVPKRNLSSVILGYGFSTAQEKGSPHYHADETAAATTVEELEQAIDAVIAETIELDIPEIDRYITRALDRTNQKLIAFGNMIACGVYAGGCVFHCENGHYACVPFGGAYVYSWDGNHLTLLYGGPSKDGLIRDAVGAGGNKNIFLYYDEIRPGQTICISSDPLRNIAEAEECFAGTKTVLARADALFDRIAWNRRDGIIALICNQEKLSYGKE